MSMDMDDFDLDAFLAECEAAERDEQAADRQVEETGEVTPELLDKMVDRIKKLLNKAEGAANQEEADAYNAKANALIAKYGIDSLMLATDKPADLPPGVTDRWVTVFPPYVDDRGMLLTGIATVLGCKTVYHEEGPNRRYHVFGMAADLLRFEVLFQSLIVQMQRELERALSRVLAQGAQRKVYSRDFMAGYRVTVRRRLEEAEKAARSAAETGRGEQAGSAGTSVALAIVDRTALVDRKLAEVYPKLTKARPRQARSGAGVLAGVEAGNRANITGGTDLAGGSARGALPR